MINSDWFIKQGYSHKMCQDYAIAGDNFIVLSDGCSGSPYTDVGSRLLCFAAASLLTTQKYNIPDRDIFGQQVISTAYASARNLSLPLYSLDATLLVAFELSDRIVIYTYGDGCYIYESIIPDMPPIYYNIEYENNAPEYLSYWLDKKRFDRYKNEFGGKSKLFTSFEDPRQWEHYDITSNDSTTVIPKSLLLCITLMSDGISSFTIKEDGVVKPFSDIEAIDKLIQIPPGIGEYVKRRSNVAYRFFNKSDIDHYDDLSIVSMHIKEE